MKVITTLKKKQPLTPTEAILVFLDEIEKNTTKSVDPSAAIVSMAEAITKALENQTERLLPLPYPTQKPLDLSSVVNATLSVSNQILQSSNKSEASILRQLDLLIDTNRAIIAQLEQLNKPKKWKMTPDRNHTTKMIQSVTIEQV